MQSTAPTALAVPPRLSSLDAYRGLAMILMASEALHIPRIARNFKESGVWQFLAYQTDHAPWRGCALWDLIQPSFMFMVGVALPFSLASRQSRGQPFWLMLLHAIWRSLLLVALGIFLRSTGSNQTNFTFEDVLTQIGLGYTFLFLLAFTPPLVQFITAISILVGYWLAFALHPLPPADFNYASVEVKPNWQFLKGFAAHWEKNTNFAHHFDVWFLNLLPREKPFKFNGGGYLTLSFIPSLATMIFGLLCGGLLKSGRTSTQKVKLLLIASAIGFASGLFLDIIGLCPSVKRIWTPSWVLFSTGWTCLLLAVFYYIIDVKSWRAWSLPLIVVGVNSIAMYMMAHLYPKFIERNLKTHLGQHIFEFSKDPEAPINLLAPMFEMSAVLLILWLICYWMYRRKIFIRI